MTGRLVRINTLLLTVTLFVAIWIFAIDFEMGDSNAAIMYLLIGVLPVAIYVALNTIMLSYLVVPLKRLHLDILAFLAVPVISYLLSSVAGILTPVKVFTYMTLSVAILNMLTYMAYKSRAVRAQND